MTNLEQSFTEIKAAHRLTTLAVGMMTVGEREVATATVHWNDGEHQCASGHGSSILVALNSALNEAAARRAAPVITALADEPLPIAEAA